MNTLDRHVLRGSWESWISSDDRPRVGPWWLQWVWTLAFAMLLAVGFTLLGFVSLSRDGSPWREPANWAGWYGRNLVVCLSVAVAIHLLFDVGRKLLATPARLARWQPWKRSLYFAGTPLLGVAIGWPLGVWLAGPEMRAWLVRGDGGDVVVGSVVTAVLISFVLHHFFAAKTRQIDAERRATEARLLLLQGQIEPHFLFNTLANVQSLMEHDPARARALLEHFTGYLRASLGALRAEDGTLAQELERVRSYLELLQARMDDRLAFRIEADDAVRAQPLPPLLLQPLVENAVVHGLEPSIEGGTVRVSARRDGARLVLEVHDDGRGLDAPPRRAARAGAGLALENIRQRLQARYGGRATLTLERAEPGTRARLVLPFDEGAAA